jgi:hypothetical protein
VHQRKKKQKKKKKKKKKNNNNKTAVGSATEHKRHGSLFCSHEEIPLIISCSGFPSVSFFLCGDCFSTNPQVI